MYNQKKHDLIIVRWSTYLASFRCYLGFSGVSLEMLKLQNVFFFSCFSKATMFSQILKWFWMSIFWRVYSIMCLTCIYRTCKNVKRFLVFFLQCKQQREILFTLAVTTFHTEATSFSFFGFFTFSPEVFLNIHFANAPLNQSKNNRCISNLLLCNFGICKGNLCWVNETLNSYFLFNITSPFG